MLISERNVRRLAAVKPNDPNDPEPVFQALLRLREALQVLMVGDNERQKNSVSVVGADGISQDAKDRQVQLETVREANNALIDCLAESIERAS